jgi:NTP pyrophosphatase (non-canonical NTP hydrolase)
MPAQTNDAQTTVSELRQEIRRFAAERDWDQYHTPKNLVMSIAIEAAELMEHFQWISSEKSRELVKQPETQALVADELADVLIYCLILANQAEVDVSRAILSKLERNKGRYPIGYMPTKGD